MSDDEKRELPEQFPLLTATEPFDPGKTQPLKPLTAEDVLEVFMTFQTSLLAQTSKRDKDVLTLIRDGQSEMLKQYSEWLERTEAMEQRAFGTEARVGNLEASVEAIRKWKHERANKFESSALKRLDDLERDIKALKERLPEPSWRSTNG